MINRASATWQLNRLQAAALYTMTSMAILTFVAGNMHALLWQSSDWLVGAVLPAVVVDLTNQERGELHTRPLQRNARLDEAATKKAQHMAEHGYFAHFAPDGTTPWSFFKAADYQYAHAGENLAIHFTDSDQLVAAWMNSPAHKENIVNTRFTEIGVGTARGRYEGHETVFVVQLFGTPAAPSAAVAVEAPVVPAAAPTPTAVTPAPAPAAPAKAETTVADLLAEARRLQARADQLAADQAPAAPAAAPPTPAAPAAVLSAQAEAPSTPPPAEPVPAATTVTAPATPAAYPVVVSSRLATSSGLPPITPALVSPEAHATHAGATIASMATRPNLVLDIVYSVLISVVLALLSLSLLLEVRQLHVVQVAYSLLLFAGVGGLWFIHSLLTSGAVVL